MSDIFLLFLYIMHDTTPVFNVAGASESTEVSLLKDSLLTVRNSHRHALSDLRKKIRQHVQLQQHYFDLASFVEEGGKGN